MPSPVAPANQMDSKADCDLGMFLLLLWRHQAPVFLQTLFNKCNERVDLDGRWPPHASIVWALPLS